jgi:hypothetical protein
MNFSAFFTGVSLCMGIAFSQTNFAPWAHYRNLTLNTSATGANVAATHVFFPVLVRFDSTHADVFTASRGRGADIRFTKANGITRIPHQIEQWDSAGRKAAVWVLVDTVAGNNATQGVRMYWGKGGEADSSRGSAVFATSRGYVGVYHMNETVATAGALDATGNALNLPQYDAEYVGNPSLATAAGLIGGARSFAGGADASGYKAFYSTSPLFAAPTKVTVSTWFRTNRSQNNNRIFQRTRTDNILRFMLTGTTGQFAFQTNGETAITGSLPAPVTNTWRLLHVVADSTGRRVYIDGVQLASGTSTADLYLGEPDDFDGLFVGAKPTTTTASNYFQGEMDEFRYASVSRPATWVRLEFENQKAAQTLMTVGATQNQTAAPVIAYTTPVTVQAGFSLTNAPVYSGGPVTSFAINPALSAGLAFNTTSGVISGTPTAAQGATVYTDTATGPGGTVNPTVSITVTAATAPVISYTTPVTDTVGRPSIPRAPVSTGGAITKFSINPALSAGLRLDTNTGVISGTPTAAAAATAYTVTATGLGGAGTAPINITVVSITGIAQDRAGGGAAFTARAAGSGLVFRFPQGSHAARASIADMSGRMVWSREIRGSVELFWNGVTAEGGRAARGTYHVRMDALDANGNLTASFDRVIAHEP